MVKLEGEQFTVRWGSVQVLAGWFGTDYGYVGRDDVLRQKGELAGFVKIRCAVVVV